jgi:hypothetical protein
MRIYLSINKVIALAPQSSILVMVYTQVELFLNTLH